jgi:tRNA(adenine34) deaminase
MLDIEGYRNRGTAADGSGSMQNRRAGRSDVTSIDLQMMKRAIELGRAAAQRGEVPIGAVVYRGTEIIAEGSNNREATSDPVGHAELLAVSEAGRRLKEWRLNDCSLAVTLEPCPMCAGAMVNARVGRVIYGATDPKAGACDTMFHIPTDKRLNHACEVIGGVLADECADLLREFFRNRRKANKAKRQLAQA